MTCSSTGSADLLFWKRCFSFHWYQVEIETVRALTSSPLCQARKARLRQRALEQPGRGYLPPKALRAWGISSHSFLSCPGLQGQDWQNDNQQCWGTVAQAPVSLSWVAGKWNLPQMSFSHNGPSLERHLRENQGHRLNCPLSHFSVPKNSADFSFAFPDTFIEY